jgi:hypothetical protein
MDLASGPKRHFRPSPPLLNVLCTFARPLNSRQPCRQDALLSPELCAVHDGNPVSTLRRYTAVYPEIVMCEKRFRQLPPDTGFALPVAVFHRKHLLLSQSV